MTITPGHARTSDKAAINAGLVSSTLKILPDSALDNGLSCPIFRMVAVRNEYAPFQVVVTASKPFKKVAIMAGNLVDGKGGAIAVPTEALLLVENVSVQKPSITRQNAAAQTLPPVLWPDPLPPFRPFPLNKGETRSIWVDLFIPPDVEAGTYRGIITVLADSTTSIELPVHLDVRDITIPSIPHVRTAFGNASLPACLEKVHGVKKGSAEFQNLLEEYYWFLVEHRVSPYYIPVDIFDDNAHRFLDDPRVTSFVVPVSADAAGTSRIWDDEAMRRLSNRLEETEWIKKGFFYLIDEPSPKQTPDVILLGQRVHAVNPRFKYLMTPHSGHLLLNESVLRKAGIDIWAPLLTVMSAPAERRLLLNEQKHGRELWWYTCVAPKWRGMNYFIDENATAPRLHPWMNCLYGNEGILYWETANWTQVDCNPWEKTETYPTGNGDGSLLYPGRNGYHHPVASMRLKILREGLEDYELLKVLESRLKETASMIGGLAANYNPKKRLFEHSFALIIDKGRAHPLGEDTPFLKYVTQDYRDVERQRNILIEEAEQVVKLPHLLVDTSPCDNGYTVLPVATVTGYAQSGVSLRVNEKDVQPEQNRFVSVIPLVDGANIVTITAKDQTGSGKTIRRTVNKK